MKRRSNQAPRRYERQGYLALEPKAFLDFFMIPESRDNEIVGDVAVVDICGPLDAHDDGWCDSYEAIRGRVAQACATTCKAIVMRIDSPGGDVAGMADTARALRRSCAAAGKPLYAYIEKACSAAYALATAAQSIWLSETALVGSIGVISTRADCSAMNAARGVRVAFIASGAHKVDGHPDAPISDAEVKATQRIVDSLAVVFFALVAEQRGTTVAAVEALDANTFHGEAAIRVGLADGITTFEALLVKATEGKAMADKSPYDEARAALEKAAEGDDANAAAAKRALAAMDDGGADEDDEDKDEPDAAAAQGDDKEPDAASAAAEAGASAEPADDSARPPKPKSASAMALEALQEVHKLRAEQASGRARAERKRLIASRPDFDPKLVAMLQNDKLTSIEAVREAVKTLPVIEAAKKPTTKQVAATATAIGTRGSTQGVAGDSAAIDPVTSELDERFGLVATKIGCEKVGNTLRFGVVRSSPTTDAAAVSGNGGAK